MCYANSIYIILNSQVEPETCLKIVHKYIHKLCNAKDQQEYVVGKKGNNVGAQTTI